MTTQQNLHILSFAGSLRKSSFNKAILEQAKTLVPDNVTLEIFDLANIPLYNEDVEEAGMPEAVVELAERLKQADALLISTPEYNYSISGVLKNAIDWLSVVEGDPLKGKPVAIMGVSAGGFGTVRAQYHLRQIMVYLDMYPINKPEVMISSAYSKFDETLTLVDEKSIALIQELLVNLSVWAKRLKTDSLQPTLN